MADPFVISHDPADQRRMYFESLGDQWLEENREALGKRQVGDPIIEFCEKIEGMDGSKILEIGCGNGWRLEALREKYGCKVSGIDPSSKGIEECRAKGIDAVRGSADALPWKDDEFNMIIFGFCIYAIDPKDIFRVVAESDRVLKDGGILIVHDFASTHRFSYYAVMGGSHSLMWAFFYDWPALWLAHPFYEGIVKNILISDSPVHHELMMAFKKNAQAIKPLTEGMTRGTPAEIRRRV